MSINLKLYFGPTLQADIFQVILIVSVIYIWKLNFKFFFFCDCQITKILAFLCEIYSTLPNKKTVQYFPEGKDN